jgi:BioD-like phosphotransacetylase family protein
MFMAAFHFQKPEQDHERVDFMERLKQSALDAAPLVEKYADKWKM